MKQVKAIGVFCLLSLLAGLVGGCTGKIAKGSAVPTPQSSPRTYFAAAVEGGWGGSKDGTGSSPYSDSSSLATYTIDDKAETFAQFTYAFSGGGVNQQGPQMNYSGNITTLSRGLLGLGIDYSHGPYGQSFTGSGNLPPYNPPLTDNWAIELSGQAGGLVNLQGMPFVPLVAALDCPNFTTPTTFQFVTIPASVTNGTTTMPNWNSLFDTAYGRVDVSTSGNAVTFNNIQQFNGNGMKLMSYQDLANNPSSITSTTGACSPTFFGNTVSAPNPLTITKPGIGQTVQPAAVVGIGPSGLLLEANKTYDFGTSNSSISGYQPFLGAATGAIGLPKPSSPIDTIALTGAQYLGILYGGGSTGSDWTSLIASFGFQNLPSNCPVIPSLKNPIYGGDFPGDNPGSVGVQANGGYGNCDVVIDLGAQDTANNGLFPNATVYVGSAFAGNRTNNTYPFSATAIAGQLNGKYAIFLIGVDTVGTPNQTWGIYLLQSN